MAKALVHAHPDKVLQYERLIATNPAVEPKGATVPNTTVNGHMFSYLSKDGKMALRLPQNELEAFLKRYKTRLCESYGVVQKEYAEVPDTLLAKTAELKKYFDISLSYVSGLKPKKSGKGSK